MKKIFQFAFRVILSLLVITVGISIGIGGMLEMSNSSILGYVVLLLGLGLFVLGLSILIRSGTELLDSIGNAQASDNISALNKHQRNRLKLITALYALLLPVACFYTLGISMLGDGHVDGCSFTPEYIFAIFLVAYPFIIIGAVIAAWFFQNKNHPLLALLSMGLPILFPVIMSIMSVLISPACR